MARISSLLRSILRITPLAAGLCLASVQAAPLITSITPSSGPSQGSTAVTITGSGFGKSPTAMLNSTNMAISSISDTTIIANTPAGEGTGKSIVVVADGQTSNSATFDYLAPSITTVTPALAPTSGGTTITLTGSSFGINSSLTVNGNSVSPNSRTHTRILFTMPAGQGTGVPIVVTAAGQSSNSASISYSSPSITSITPSTGPTAGNVPITISGVNFGTSRSVSIGGRTASVTSGTHTQLVVTLPAGDGVNQAVIVSSGGQTSNSAQFSYTPPIITGITPASGPTAGGTSITLTGSSFGLSPSVSFNGSTLGPTSISHTQVVFTLPQGQGTDLPIIVSSAGQTSSPIAFSYSPPSITSITPSTGPTAGNVPITISGLNFGTSRSVSIGGRTASVTSGTHTQLVVTLPAGDGVNQAVIVSSGGQTSNSAQFSYTPPIITGITPASGPTAGGTSITLTGSSFGLSPSVSFNGNTLGPTSISHTQVVFTLPQGQGTDLPIIVSSAGQTSSPIAFSYSPPSINSITPSTGPTAGNVPITISGLNFGTSRTVSIGGINAPLSAAGNSHTQLVVTLPPGQGANKNVVVSVDGRQSNAVSFHYAAPQISAISYASAPTEGGTLITLTGNNFGTSGSVSINGLNAPITGTGSSYSNSSIVLPLPAGQGTNLPVVVSSAGQESSALALSYDPPALLSIAPATGPTNGGTSITINGKNFGVSQSVIIGDKTALTTFSSHTRLVATLPSGSGASLPVAVNVGDRSSNSGSFSYLPPVISSISPATGPISGGTSITIVGENFGTAPSLTIGSKTVAQFASRTHGQIICTLPTGSGQNKPVIVNASGQTSNTMVFSYDTRAFSDWAAAITWNGLDSSLQADPRQNGWKNSLAYAFGVDPTTTTGGETASLFPPVRGRPAFSRNAGGALQLSFWRRRSEAYPDLSYQVEFSNGLGASSWESASRPPLIEIVDDEWEFRTYSDHSGGTGRFGRVQIRVQP